MYNIIMRRYSRVMYYALIILSLIMSTRFPVALADDWDQGSEVDQGLFEDAKPANKPQAPVEPPADAPPALPKQVVGLRGVVRLSYYLYPTKEQVELTYNFRVNESCDRPERLEQPHSCSFKGDATVETHVLGQLAKWNGGQCLLQVKVPNIPFALEYIESPEGVVTIKVPSLGPVQESWESQCSFTSEPNFSVKTMGEPEVWINKGLNKAKEAIEALS